MSTVVSVCTVLLNIQNLYLLCAQCTMQSAQLNTNYFPLHHWFVWPWKGQDILCERGPDYLYILESIGGGDYGVGWSGSPHPHKLLDSGHEICGIPQSVWRLDHVVRSSNPGRSNKVFPFFFETGPGVHLASCTVGTGVLSRGGWGSKAAEAWCWPLNSIYCQDWDWVEQYLHPKKCLQNVERTWATELFFEYKNSDTNCSVYHICMYNTCGYKVPGITLSRGLKCWSRPDFNQNLSVWVSTGKHKWCAVGTWQKGRSVRLLFIMQVGSRLSADFKRLPPSLALLYPPPNHVRFQGGNHRVLARNGIGWSKKMNYDLSFTQSTYWKHCKYLHIAWYAFAASLAVGLERRLENKHFKKHRAENRTKKVSEKRNMLFVLFYFIFNNETRHTLRLSTYWASKTTVATYRLT